MEPHGTQTGGYIRIPLVQTLNSGPKSGCGSNPGQSDSKSPPPNASSYEGGELNVDLTLQRNQKTKVP